MLSCRPPRAVSWLPPWRVLPFTAEIEEQPFGSRKGDMDTPEMLNAAKSGDADGDPLLLGRTNTATSLTVLGVARGNGGSVRE